MPVRRLVGVRGGEWTDRACNPGWIRSRTNSKRCWSRGAGCADSKAATFCPTCWRCTRRCGCSRRSRESSPRTIMPNDPPFGCAVAEERLRLPQRSGVRFVERMLTVVQTLRLQSVRCWITSIARSWLIEPAFPLRNYSAKMGTDRLQKIKRHQFGAPIMLRRPVSRNRILRSVTSESLATSLSGSFSMSLIRAMSSADKFLILMRAPSVAYERTGDCLRGLAKQQPLPVGHRERWSRA